MTQVLRFYHQTGLRLSSTYVLALVQAAIPGESSLLAYPAAATWGFLLQMGGVALCRRWLLRLPHLALAGALFAYAILPHPAHFAHHDGFFAQAYGIAALLFAVVFLALLRRRGGGEGATLWALSAASLLSVYPPLAPPLAGSTAWQAAQAWWHRHGPGGTRKLLLLATCACGAFLLFAALDLHALAGRLATLASIKVGGHISQSLGDWLAFAMGTSAGGGSTRGPWLLLAPLAAAIGGALALLGAVHLARVPRTRVLVAAWLVLAAGLGYYALLVADPWTGRTGHTWSAFKLVQWSYPFVFVLQCGGLLSLPRRARGTASLLALLLALALAPQLAVWLRADRATSLAGIVRARRPLDQVNALRDRLRGLPPGPLVLLGRAPGRRVGLLDYLCLLSYPRPILREADVPDDANGVSSPPDAVFLVCRSPTTPRDPVPDLGWGCGPLAMSEPVLVELDGRGRAWRDLGRLPVVLFAPRETKAVLVIPLPRRPRPWPAVTVLGSQGAMARIEAGPAQSWRVPLRLRPGLNHLELRADMGEAGSLDPIEARLASLVPGSEP